MSDFRIIISAIEDIEPVTLAENIMAAHGDAFDASLGEFSVETSSYGLVTVTVLNVGGGDIDMLANDIERNEDGSFTLRVSQRDGSNWFARDEGDDEL